MKILFKITIFFIPICTFGQGQEALWFHPLGKEEGISNVDYIYAVFQDSEGYTWIGTESSLDQFDGRNFIHHLPDPRDTFSLSANSVVGRIFEDQSGNLWLCNYYSIQCYLRREKHFKSYQITDGRGLKVESGYQAIYLEKDSVLWIKAGREIYRFNTGTLESRKVAQTTMDIDVFPGLTKTGEVQYLFAIDGSKSEGLEILRFGPNGTAIGNDKIFIGKKYGLPSINVHDVLYENDTSLWLSSDRGLHKWNMLTLTCRDYPFLGSIPTFFEPLNEDEFVVSKFREGLYLFNKAEGKFKGINCRLVGESEKNTNLLIKYPYIINGILWVVLDGQGLMFGNPQKTKFGSIPKHETFNKSRSFAYRTMIQREDGKIWASTLFHGLFLLDEKGKVLRHYHPNNPISNSLNSYQINHMIKDRDGYLWVATAKGISYFNEKLDRFIPLFDANGQEVSFVSYLHQLKDGTILASTLQHGIYKIDLHSEPWTIRPFYQSSDNNNQFVAIFQDETESVYITRNRNEIVIFNYETDQLKPLITKKLSGFINGFYEDPEGKYLWVATEVGLGRIDQTNLQAELQFFPFSGGVQQNQIQALVGQPPFLWLSTSVGILRFNINENYFDEFTPADGMQSKQFHPYAMLKHQNGNIWIGGNEGITIINPEKVNLLEYKPKIQITNIKINDEVKSYEWLTSFLKTTVNSSSILALPYKNNTVSMDFVAIDYGDPFSTQLEYKLDRIDNNWVRLDRGEQGFARYPNLPPGRYTFQVKAANSDGIWSDEIKTLSIKIKPPWYLTWWAITLFILAALGAIYAYYRYRVRQIQKEEAYKRKEAEYKQQMAETETAILRLQMNPHFIFNSMNSISSYIEQKDIDTANDYLNRFAKLMRTILKQAEKPFLSLYEEQDLLEQYLNTEAMRFEDNIDYEFKMSDDMDPEDYIIPTMILQPFIENAIWHGLAKKEGAKKIIIGFEVEGEELVCSVEDNGIGRSASSEFKAASSSHESQAIKITQRRLEILEERENRPTQLKIIDLKDEQGQPAGTKVIIRLPVL